MIGRRIDERRQRHPLLARHNALLQPDKHDESIWAIEPQEDRSTTIQQAGTI
ncbi:hypothetical protein [Bradyrhizobium sp. LHD-71]|uniref:hypothetical protein n=1 Tax=Bradyrhizobium sp. LHD-71 TaxID=3072141 RepID=UPI00280F083C|nr:hypothetical protein [Bradyrhizobium sp. LHD-71]MDQ8730500.1 hypothetical protein [Bradyrhizobium sp. LHD-71]